MNNTNRISDLNVHLFTIRKEIAENLEQKPPTIIISNETGLYVMSDQITKVYTTIVLAGSGRSFQGISNWFREQINKLVLSWGPNVPKASVEGKILLPQAFGPNTQYSDYIAYGDITVIEVAATPQKDTILHVNFLGDCETLPGNQIHYLSHKNLLKLIHKKDQPEDKNKNKGENEINQKIEGEKKHYNIENTEALQNPEKLQSFIARWSHAKAFLKRKKLINKEYDWIYQKL